MSPTLPCADVPTIRTPAGADAEAERSEEAQLELLYRAIKCMRLDAVLLAVGVEL